MHSPCLSSYSYYINPIPHTQLSFADDTVCDWRRERYELSLQPEDSSEGSEAQVRCPFLSCCQVVLPLSVLLSSSVALFRSCCQAVLLFSVLLSSGVALPC